MLRRDEIDIVHATHILQLDVPFGQLLRTQIKATTLVRNIMVLAEDAAQVTAAEEDATRPVMSLDAGLFAKVRRDSIDLHIRADEAGSSFLEAVHAAEARAEVAFSEVCIGFRALSGGVDGGEEVVAGNVVIEQVRSGEVEMPPLGDRW